MDVLGLQPIVVFDSSISGRSRIVVYEKWKDNWGLACYAQVEMKISRIAGLFGLFLALSQAQTIHTGPSVGQPVPEFSAPDQAGQTQTLRSVMGPKGLMLVFFRSADW